MRLKVIVCGIAAGCSVSAFGQARNTQKQHKPYFKLLESYTQRTIPGIKRSQPILNTRFIIIWENATFPEVFYWKGDSTTRSCFVVKAHKITANAHNLPPGIDYTTENITPDQIKPGDTLQLTVAPNGTVPAPAAIPRDKQNTLFFKTKKSNWLLFPVKSLTRKQDIPMP